MAGSEVRLHLIEPEAEVIHQCLWRIAKGKYFFDILRPYVKIPEGLLFQICQFVRGEMICLYNGIEMVVCLVVCPVHYKSVPLCNLIVQSTGEWERQNDLKEIAVDLAGKIKGVHYCFFGIPWHAYQECNKCLQLVLLCQP